eukprot:6985873-Prorocentrum_lima.AAC.1
MQTRGPKHTRSPPRKTRNKEGEGSGLVAAKGMHTRLDPQTLTERTHQEEQPSSSIGGRR